jgi:hypothetical protein
MHILARPMIAALLMWAVIAGLRAAFTDVDLHVALRLALWVAAGAVTYTLFLHALSRQYLRDFTELAARLTKRG